MSDQTEQSARTGQAAGISRRGLLRGVGTGAVVVGGGGLLEACSSGIKGASSGGTKSITIGWIHPLTGSLAGFGAPDNWVISKIKQTTPYKNGFKIGGKTYPVTIKSYDTQSSPTRAGDLAKTAILSDGVDLLFAASTPETVNAVASQAESLHTPLICANIPWESWYINLGGNPQKPTLKPKYVVMYFLGAEHLVQAFIPMWNRIHAQLDTVAKVLLFPPDAYALGPLAYNVATDAWWAPTLPWKSSFTGETCQQMANEFEASHGQWHSNISNYSLFEVAHAALTMVSDPHDKAEVADAIHKVNIQALAGPLDFASGKPAPGVAITPPLGVQWQKGTKYPLEMQVGDNT